MTARTPIAPGLWRWTAPHPGWRSGALPGSPDDWDQQVGADLAALLRPLLDLGVERVLVSHGQAVLRDGAKALARALDV
jgi:hypothetical protein